MYLLSAWIFTLIYQSANPIWLLLHHRLCSLCWAGRAGTHTNSARWPDWFHTLMWKYFALIFALQFCLTLNDQSRTQMVSWGSTGSGPTNFIPTAAYSECITIPLSRFYLTLWMCHVHRDGSFRISLMQHSQTSVKPLIHLKKNVRQALSVKIPHLHVSPILEL